METDAAQPDPPARLRTLPSWLIAEAAAAARREIRAALADVGVSRHHVAVLTTLAQDGETTQAELGRRLGLDRSDLHAVAGDLEARRWVRRRPDPDDGRRTLIALTRAGTAGLRRLDVRVDRAQESLLAPLSPADRRRLVDLLGQLVDHHRRPVPPAR